MRRITNMSSAILWRFALLTLLLIPVLSTSVNAQSADDLNRLYGPSFDGRFHVHDNIDVIANCPANQHPCEMRIEPHTSKDETSEEIPIATADAILNEITPLKQRGRWLGSGSFESGRNGMLIDIYEHVVVVRATTWWEMHPLTVNFATVKWVEHQKKSF